MAKQTPYEFFLEHAGYGWYPEWETPEHGQRRNAQRLAIAERRASDAGIAFAWERDGFDSSEWTDERDPPTATWQCTVFDSNGHSIDCMGGIDFGDGEPWGAPYRRVVEAQMAMEIDFASMGAEA